jgi:hypothetical protein
VKHHDPPGDIRRLRTFAVLLQRGEEVAIDTHGWNSDHGQHKITFSADNLIFWRTFNELHPHPHRGR